MIGGLVVLVLVLVVVDRVAVRVSEGLRCGPWSRATWSSRMRTSTSRVPLPHPGDRRRARARHRHGGLGDLRGYTVTDVHLDARGVSTSEPHVLQSGTATGLLAASSLDAPVSEAAGAPVTFSTEGELLVASMDVLGLDLAARLTPLVDGNTIAVDVDSLTLGPATITISDLPAPIANLVTNVTVLSTSLGRDPHVRRRDGRCDPGGAGRNGRRARRARGVVTTG
ncbi:hypothetical protein NKG05_11515 [Oerskovia sp. M15]